MAITIWQSFFVVDPDQFGPMAEDVQQQMKNCSGNYQQRSDCKEAILDAKQQHSFLAWGEKVATIFGPPAILWFLVAWATKNNEPVPPTPRRRVASGNPPRRPGQTKRPGR
jgi:hypothetical protein